MYVNVSYTYFSCFVDESVKMTPTPFCRGKRCELGECVPWERVCDGVPDCRDEQDETIKLCQERTEKCKTNNTLCSNKLNIHK